MDTFKSISGLIFVLGMPLFCFSLLRNYRRRKTYIPFMGWSLFAVGFLMIFVAIFSSLPTFIFFPQKRSAESIIYFLVWLVPSTAMVYTGWTTRNKPRSNDAEK
ncbi:MAG: hypothetical protein NT056_00360 [Proteobacteria bacterium]|nr:hypothetical protein [Pseudomonadota bacterium]